MKVVTNSPSETKKAGYRLGKTLKAGDVVCLYGDLGAGKTTFVKGIGEALGIPGREVASASFTIIAEYVTGKIPFYHIDLYRINSEQDLETTGIYDFLGGPGVAVVEWAGRMPELRGAVKVAFRMISERKREILMEDTREAA